MKAEELRIGNIVQFGSGRIEPVTILNINDFSLGYLDLKPVFLTSEWLDRLGFDQDNQIELTGGTVITLHPTGEGSLLGWSRESEIKFEVLVEYVHQAQNLFYALSGVELTKKP